MKTLIKYLGLTAGSTSAPTSFSTSSGFEVAGTGPIGNLVSEADYGSFLSPANLNNDYGTFEAGEGNTDYGSF